MWLCLFSMCVHVRQISVCVRLVSVCAFMGVCVIHRLALQCVWVCVVRGVVVCGVCVCVVCVCDVYKCLFSVCGD